MLELNAVNTNAGVREKKKKRTEKGSVTIDITQEMMTCTDLNLVLLLWESTATTTRLPLTSSIPVTILAFGI